MSVKCLHFHFGILCQDILGLDGLDGLPAKPLIWTKMVENNLESDVAVTGQ
jgi:hypothetical protein